MMKKVLFGGILMLSAAAYSQAVPNGGMENWANQGFYYDPASWATTNIVAVMSGGTSNVSRDNDAHSGTYSAKIQTVLAGDPGEEDTIPGSMFLGNINLQEMEFNIGAPFTSRPDSLVFWYKYSPVNGDSFGVGGSLLMAGEPIADFELIESAASSTWKRKAVGIEYTAAGAPDTLIIAFSSSAESPSPGTVLKVDDISFVYNATVSTPSVKSQDEIKTWPNPAKETLNVKLAKEATIEIYNVLGSKVATIRSNGTENTEISTAEFTNGVYILKTSTGISQRFVVKH